MKITINKNKKPTKLDYFQIIKKNTLEKFKTVDNSKKGSVDKEILPLVKLINKNPNLYTTSSCAGRIVLFKEPLSGKKNHSEWLLVSHSLVKCKSMKEIIDSLNPVPKETIWLKQEPFIIHVGVSSIEKANELMDILRSIGLKHSGILTTKKRILIEIKGNEYMDTPIIKDSNILIDENYLNILVFEANKKLKKSRTKMKLLFEKIKGYKDQHRIL